MLTTIAMHPEDIKAGLRKRYGTVANFERAKALPEKSVNDVLRGRPNARVLQAIKDALASPTPMLPQSELSDDSDEHLAAHRLSDGRPCPQFKGAN